MSAAFFLVRISIIFLRNVHSIQVSRHTYMYVHVSVFSPGFSYLVVPPTLLNTSSKLSLLDCLNILGWVIMSCGFMVIKYNNAWWCKIKILTSVGGADSNIGGATPPQKGLTRTLVMYVYMYGMYVCLLVVVCSNEMFSYIPRTINDHLRMEANTCMWEYCG